MREISRIQALWRGFRMRRLLTRAQGMPNDVWSHIKSYMKGCDLESRRKRCVLRIITIRVLRIKYSTPSVTEKLFPNTSRLVRAHFHTLPPRISKQMLQIALRVLKSNPNSKMNACANIFLEDAIRVVDKRGEPLLMMDCDSLRWTSDLLPH